MIAPDGEVATEDFAKVQSAVIRDHVSRAVPLGMGKITEDFEQLPSQDEFWELHDRALEQANEIRGHATARSSSAGNEPPVTSDIVRGTPRPAQIPPARPPGPQALAGGLGALGGAVPGTPPARAGVGTEEPPVVADARVLTVQYDGQDQRFRNFRECVNMSNSPEWPDWPLTGPRTTLWCLKWMLNRSGSPTAWHQQWVSLGKLNHSDPLVLAHEFACRALESGACYDQMNLGSLASFEVLARQLQNAEDLLADKFTDSRDDHYSDVFLMTGANHKSQLCICPELRAFTASETQKEASILKERRKAREERVLAQPKAHAKAKAQAG